MSLDGIAIHAITDELSHILIGGRVDKVQQPDATTITLLIRQHGTNLRLLLSAHPQTARMALTQTAKPNPAQPPLFCMVLRKHLEGAKITAIRQIGWERIVHLVFEGYDELGERASRTLVCEFMGKHSNLILINPETNVIYDSVRRLHADMSQYRQVLPGLHYVTPPEQNKLDFTTLSVEELVPLFIEAPANQPLKKILLANLSGLGPQSAAELIFRANLDPDGRAEFLGEYDYQIIWQQLKWLSELLEQQTYQPTIVYDHQKALAFAPFPLMQFHEYEQVPLASMSELLETFIGRKEADNGFQQRLSDLEHIINHQIERCEKKLALQMEKVSEGDNAEELKIWGELLTANLYQLQQGEQAQVVNFYDPEQKMLTIPMLGHLTPNENAQRYFKRYAKAKNGAEKALEQAQHTQEELDYLDTIKDSLGSAQTLDDIIDIRLELEAADYVKAKLTKQNKKIKKEPTHKPLTVEQDGFQILVGKNNVQNDYLTLKIARNNDVWFHAKDMPGSHVVIKNHQEQREIPKEILDLAAHLAAYFSKGKHSALVPVDYTLKKYVHKPNGAKPGRVIDVNQKTIYITPDEEAIEGLFKRS